MKAIISIIILLFCAFFVYRLFNPNSETENISDVLNLGNTKIEKILSNPEKFDGIEISIRGKISKSKGLFKLGYYEINDGTGMLPVVVIDTYAPKSGETMTIKGKVVQVYRSDSNSKIIFYQTEK
jgi:aspartyl/asparaginyl-tRNA synthetase